MGMETQEIESKIFDIVAKQLNIERNAFADYQDKVAADFSKRKANLDGQEERLQEIAKRLEEEQNKLKADRENLKADVLKELNAKLK